MVSVRLLSKAEINAALVLALRVFMRFEAPDYSAEGVETFRRTLADTGFINRLTCYGAFEGDEFVGMIATRNDGLHITLFFVEEEYQRRGIGRMLLSKVLAQANGNTITVNASPFAVEIYKKLGFFAHMKEQVTDGIRYTPMRMPVIR